MDDRPKFIGENDSVIIGEFFEIYGQPELKTSGSWHRFRGSEYDNISRDATPIAEAWPEAGPPVVWQINLGEGHAAPAVHNGKVYLLDYDEKIKAVFSHYNLTEKLK